MYEGLVGNGIYTIDPDGAGGNAEFNVYCDMETDGGGWTLIMNYLHLAGTNVASAPRTYFPVQKSTTLGVDESADTEAWGHATPATVNTLAAFTSLRFHCKTSNHARVIHFKSYDLGYLNYIRTGTGSGNITNDDGFTILESHTDAYLPRSSNAYYTNQGDNALTNLPFYYTNGTSALYQFRAGIISGSTYMYYCDNYNRTYLDSTFHQAWVK